MKSLPRFRSVNHAGKTESLCASSTVIAVAVSFFACFAFQTPIFLVLCVCLPVILFPSMLLELAVLRKREKRYAEFIEDISHNLRNPLCGVTGMINLALSDDISETARGYLTTAESEAFTMLRRLDAVPGRITERTKTAPEAADCLKHKKVLVCDDAEINRLLLTKLLQSVGAEVQCAENGRVCTELLKNSSRFYFDAVLMDIRMPVMDGWQAAKEIRKLKRPDAAVIPIIAISANVLDDDRRESLKSGMYAHLAKPVDAALLFATLAEVLSDTSRPKTV